MNPVAIAEIVSAVFVCVSLFSRFSQYDHTVSMKRYKILSMVTLVCLFTDAISYIYDTPNTDNRILIGILYFVNLLTYVMSSVNLCAFTYYCSAYIREKTKLRKLTFRIPMAIMAIDVIVVVAVFFQGQLIVFSDGSFVIPGTVPDVVMASYLILLFYAPSVAIAKRKDVGKKVVVSLLAYVIPVIASIILIYTIDYDLSVVASAISVEIIGVLLQNDISQKQLEKVVSSKTLEENNARVMALQDNFEFLYDVNLETGEYEQYIKGEIFGDTNSRMVNDNNFFEYIRKNIAIIYPDDRDEILAITDPETISLKLGKEKKIDWYYRQMVDGKPLHTRLRVVYKNDARKNVIIGIFNAEEEVAAKKAEAQKQAAEAANQAKTEFLFNMSHDIRTPMNAITGFTNIAVREVNNPKKVLANLKKVQMASDMLLSLINDILDMSRIESGKTTLKKNKTDIQKIFDTIEPVLSTQASMKDIDLKFSIDNLKDRFVYADTQRLERVLVNIISNAIKYTGDNGFVEVSLSQNGQAKEGIGEYLFVIKDNGIGMSEEFQKTMFDEFTREENSTMSGVQGTGLGLALVKKLTDLMEGTITCESERGVGSTFTVTLDFEIGTEADIEEMIEEERSMESISFDEMRVLLAEDNELNRELATDILETEGFKVETAANGQIAVDKVNEHGPDYYDVVLMDIQMPVMDGYEATREIRRTVPNLKAPIIAVSANAFEEDKQKSLEAGVNAHVSKPIKVDVLLTTLRELLQK